VRLAQAWVIKAWLLVTGFRGVLESGGGQAIPSTRGLAGDGARAGLFGQDRKDESQSCAASYRPEAPRFPILASCHCRAWLNPGMVGGRMW